MTLLLIVSSQHAVVATTVELDQGKDPSRSKTKEVELTDDPDMHLKPDLSKHPVPT